MNYRITLILFIFSICPKMMQAQSDKFNELINYFIQDGRAIAWLEFREEQLAYLEKADLESLQKHIFARRGYIFPEIEWKNYFRQFDWYEDRNLQIELSPTDEKNVGLIKSFQNAQKIVPMPNSGLDFAAYLNGCWQKDSPEARSSLPDRYIFYAIDKSYAFKGDLMEKIDKRKLNFSGKFLISAKNQIEFEIITKDITIRTLGKPYKDPVSGKTYRPLATLKTKTIHLEKENGYEYKTLSVSDICYVNVGGLTKAFVKIDGEIYWQSSKSPESCD